jgi:hypothetical protein
VLSTYDFLINTPAFVHLQRQKFGELDPVRIGEAVIAVQDHLRVSFTVGFEFVEDQHEYKRRQFLRSPKHRRRTATSPVEAFRGKNLHPTVALFKSPPRCRSYRLWVPHIPAFYSDLPELVSDSDSDSVSCSNLNND